MSEWSYIIAAYAVAWLGLIGYAARVLILNRRAHRRLERAGGES